MPVKMAVAYALFLVLCFAATSTVSMAKSSDWIHTSSDFSTPVWRRTWDAAELAFSKHQEPRKSGLDRRSMLDGDTVEARLLKTHLSMYVAPILRRNSSEQCFLTLLYRLVALFPQFE